MTMIKHQNQTQLRLRLRLLLRLLLRRLLLLRLLLLLGHKRLRSKARPCFDCARALTATSVSIMRR